jgi:hypothetical protein
MKNLLQKFGRVTLKAIFVVATIGCSAWAFAGDSQPAAPTSYVIANNDQISNSITVYELLDGKLDQAAVFPTNAAGGATYSYVDSIGLSSQAI